MSRLELECLVGDQKVHRLQAEIRIVELLKDLDRYLLRVRTGYKVAGEGDHSHQLFEGQDEAALGLEEARSGHGQGGHALFIGHQLGLNVEIAPFKVVYGHRNVKDCLNLIVLVVHSNTPSCRLLNQILQTSFLLIGFLG